MKSLTYGIICEDKAHYNFITTFVRLFASRQRRHVAVNKDFYSRFRASNSKEVLKKFSQAAIIGFRDYLLDFLIIGIDYDDRNREKFDEEINALYQKLDSRFSDKSIIMFPVQAIEHWMLYIQYHLDKPKSTKNISFEPLSRKEAKRRIYKGKYAQTDPELVINLTSRIDISWLISRSESFKRFYSDLNQLFSQLSL